MENNAATIEDMDILVDFAGTVLHIADTITAIVSEFPNEPVTWQITPFLSVRDYGYTKYTIPKDTTVNTGTHRYNPTDGLSINPDYCPTINIEEGLIETKEKLAKLELSKAESEFEIDERLSKLELGLA